MWRRALNEFILDWPRTITYLCFTVYGLWSLIDPPVSISRTTPGWFQTTFNSQIAVAGVILIISMVTGSFMIRLAGFAIFFIAMFTTSILIFIGSGSPVSILVLGFAMQGLISLQVLKRNRKVGEELEGIIQRLEKNNDH